MLTANQVNRPRRPLGSILALGLPWLAIVGLLAGVEYVKSEGRLTRGLIGLFSTSRTNSLARVHVSQALTDLDSAPHMKAFVLELDGEPVRDGFVAESRRMLSELLDRAGKQVDRFRSADLLAQFEEVRASARELEQEPLEVGHLIDLRGPVQGPEQCRRSSFVFRPAPAAPRTEAPPVQIRVSPEG